MSKTAYIIGMGPAGLTSALSLLSSGYSVVLVDQRAEYDLFKRTQGIFLNTETINDFFSLSNLGQLGYSLSFDDSYVCKLIRPSEESSLNLSEVDRLDLGFFELIERERELISIGDLQRYQLSKLKDIYNQGGYTFHDGDENLSVKFDKAEQKLIIHTNTNVVRVDAKNQELDLTIDGVREVHKFDLLVDASGKTSTSFTKLWNTQNPDFAIQYEQVGNPSHTAFGVIHMSISNPTLSMMRTPVLTPFEARHSFISSQNMPQLKALGWEDERPPLVYFKYSKKSGSVYLTGEIPQKILDNKDEQELKHWFDLVIKLLFKRSTGKTTNVSLASVFKLNIEIADKYATPLPNGGFYCLVGDALMSSNLLLGSGIMNALDDANELSNMVTCQFADAESYREERLDNYNKDWNAFENFVQEVLKVLDTIEPINSELTPGF